MLLSLYAVDVFLDAHEQRLPATTSAGARHQFRRKLAEVELHVQTQSGSPIMAEGLTRAKDTKREALLRDHLAPIARVARLESVNFPALAALRMPRGAPGTGKLLAHAAGMADVAKDHTDVFVAAGLRPTFIADLNAAIDDILTTLTARTEKRGARSGATRGLRASLAACNKYKGVLDAFVRCEACGDRPLLANWRTVKRVARPPRPSRGDRVDEVPAQGKLGGPALPIRDSNRLLATPVWTGEDKSLTVRGAVADLAAAPHA
jgi:hypothetical protein